MTFNRNNRNGQLQLVLARNHWLVRLLSSPRVPSFGLSIEATRVGNDCHSMVRVFRSSHDPIPVGPRPTLLVRVVSKAFRR